MLGRLFLRKDYVNLSNIRFPLVFLGFWFYYGCLSIIWSTNKATGIKELYYFCLFLVLIIVLVYLLQSKMQNSWIAISFWFFGLVIVLICLIEFAFNIHLPTSRFIIEAERFSDIQARRATAFFYNENDLSVFLVLVFPFYLTGLLNKSIFFKLISAAGMISIIFINYYNDARLSMGANLIQFFLFVLLTKKNLINKGIRLLLLISPFILVIAFSVGVPFLQKETLFEGIKEGHGSAFIRMNLYLNSLYATFQSFMLGVGPGNFQYNIYPMFNTLGIINPHNWWLEILTNYGFVVFVGYCCFFIFILSRLYSIFRLDKKNNSLALTYLLSYCGFIFACLSPSSLFYFWPMWFFYGVSLAYIAKKKDLKV
ncbi:O-antigen ligase family protein [Neobacillus drentensis]|uniref:O-antigen ligase family protein n=1 Tax=Neobacillus drentensis TaxID=220684 RepID=UPI002FFF8DD0